MNEVILTDDQVKAITEARGLVELRDAAGTIVVKFDPMDAQALASHRKRKASGVQQAMIPGDRVRAHLEALQAEWDRTGGFDEVHLRALLAKFRSEDAHGAV
jgi:hypothetical protein